MCWFLPSYFIFFCFLFFSVRFFQVLKRRKSWVRCYFPATRSGRVWREIGTDWFTANTPSKPSIVTLAASIWPPILDRLWSSGWTLSVWPPFYKIPRAYPSREFDSSNGFSYIQQPIHLKVYNFPPFFFWQIRVEQESIGRVQWIRRSQRKSSLLQGRRRRRREQGARGWCVVRLDGTRSADRCVSIFLMPL